MTDTEVAALVERLNAWGEMDGNTLLEGASFDITGAAYAILALQQRVRELEGDAEFPIQLLNIHAICDERDTLRDRLFLANELLRDAPLHHYGRDYSTWTARRKRYFDAIDAAAIAEGGKHDEAT